MWAVHRDAPVMPSQSASVSLVMDLPSSRELELEALLRNKDSQLAELTVRTLVLHFTTSYSLRVIPGRGQHPPPVSLDSAQPITHRALVFAARTHISASDPYRCRCDRKQR